MCVDVCVCALVRSFWHVLGCVCGCICVRVRVCVYAYFESVIACVRVCVFA